MLGLLPNFNENWDTLLAPETIRHLEKLMKQEGKAKKHAPVYAYT